ncbi:MAG TPA: elongation factor G [Candidatus Eubacterium pullicola]|uniref:Elongation factor G n=1 Tax=Gallibacter intestinalis TaxID=2779356 RepID=A0ABR9QVD8_9FIRM|nr:elongation factor G [Gallibacter intestinalis]MBE5034846.1 elongation factor G [Gallibacter intestinalis]HIW40001.1 elongation factor G [Candidatus Eubacterium pullicola]
MKGYTSETIRNVALVGHGGCGKTTFLESVLKETGAIDRMGKVDEGNTVSDYDKMEKEKGYSINTSVVPVIWKENKINFIDTPGYFDFVGEVNAALRAAEAAIILVDAGAGVQVGTEQAWKACERYKKPRFIVINKRDKDEFDYYKTFDELKAKFGDHLIPFSWPITTEIDEELKEAIAMTSDELMEKYFNGDNFTEEEIKKGLAEGIADGAMVPVLSAAFELQKGSQGLLDLLVTYVPTPLQHGPYQGFNDKNEPVEKVSVVDGPVSAFVFKTIIDPFVGKISIMKVVSGKLNAGTEVLNERTGKMEKIGKLFFLRGNQQEELNYAEAGDIVAAAKLQYTLSGDTLCDKSDVIRYLPLDYPKPSLYVAIEAADKKDEDKVFSGLAKLREEDPSFTIERNNETHQTLLGGQGEIQLGIIMAKLKDRFGVEVKTVPQKIAYRETIRGTSDVQGKHKKQSGGAGQYGDVHIRFSPSQEEFEFTESLFGGSIPKNYVPAVEKGLIESMEKGPLAGCKVVNIKADLYDGSYHDVDSNEMAFKIAASLAFKKGIMEANPCLLEPIMKLEIYVPEDYMGDVMGDMNKRRGKILGMEPQADGEQKIVAEAPQAELFDYAVVLRSMTQARGHFEMDFARYEQMPQQLADKIISAYQEGQNK